MTNDLIRRVYEHKHHLDRGSITAQYNVEKLVYYEVATNPEAAIEREKQIKGWNRKRKIKLIESTNPNWDELYEKWTNGEISSKKFIELSGLKKATFYNLLTEYKEIQSANAQYLKQYKIG